MQQHWIHDLDPIIFSLGPLSVRWYGFLYLVGFVVGYLYFVKRFKKGQFALNPDQTQELFTYIMIGMIIGARIFYVFIYDFEAYKDNLFDMFKIWKGGLSFHGAAVGFIGAVYLYAKRNGYGFHHLMDLVAMGSALGLGIGRLGNFINGELYGRVTDVPWAIIFPQGGPEPRHPSQLYQSFCEGFLVFLILLYIDHRERKKGFAPPITDIPRGERTKSGELKYPKKPKLTWKRTGVLGPWFLILYGTARFAMEFFRQPDAQLGFYFKYFSMGQILCFLMILSGVIVLRYTTKHDTSQTY